MNLFPRFNLFLVLFLSKKNSGLLVQFKESTFL